MDEVACAWSLGLAWPQAPPLAPSVSSRRSNDSLKLAGRQDSLILVEERRKLPR